MTAFGASLDISKGGDAPIRQYRVSRLLAAIAALALNVPVWLVLTGSTNGSRHFRPEHTQALVVLFLDKASTANAPDVVPPAVVHHYGSRARPTHRGLDVSPVKGPPTETVEYITANSSPDLDAIVNDASAVRKLCLRTYPVELKSDLASSAEIGLRVFVMPDGRIGQGQVVNSSGDERVDLLTLKCLQANGHLEAHADVAMSTGSWQRLTWLWSLP